MSEQERIDIIRTIRDEITLLKDFLDAKYASKDALAKAVQDRNDLCKIREEKLDNKFKPVYGMLIIIILFLVAKYGIDFFTMIGKFI